MYYFHYYILLCYIYVSVTNKHYCGMKIDVYIHVALLYKGNSAHKPKQLVRIIYNMHDSYFCIHQKMQNCKLIKQLLLYFTSIHLQIKR